MQGPGIKEILRSVNIVYMAIFLTLITYIVASSLYVSNVGTLLENDPQLNYYIHTALLLLMIILAPVSYVVPQRMISRIDSHLVLEGKILAYRAAILVRFITMNTAGLLVALAFLITGNTDLILVQAIVILFFIIYKPTVFKIASDLNLDENDKKKLL